MKTNIITLLLSCILPVITFAQPLVKTNEYYHIGDIINQVRCNTEGISAGAGGANVNWDFSALGTSGGIAKTTVALNNSSEFITSNLMLTLPDGSTEYMQENNTDSYVDAIVNHSSGITRNYNLFDLAKRPITYNNYSLDTYRMVINAPLTIGTGIVTQGGDGYGTLKLPNGTYNYVLRVRRTISEKDSVDNDLSAFMNTITYMWFDTVHSAPLFRLDSISDITGTAVTAMYLASTTGIKGPHNIVSEVKGYLDNNELLLTGNFEYGKEYEVSLYNIIGVKVLREQFVGSNSTQQFNINGLVMPGIYIIDVSEKNDPASRSVIKVVRQ